MAKTPKKPANVTPIRSTVRGSGRSDSAAILDHNPEAGSTGGSTS
jgi:hypothetical protein